MSTSAKDLRETLTVHCKNERHHTYAETSYWLSQYKDLARRAIQHAETTAAKLQEQTARAEAAEVELARLREQEPIGVAVACNKDSSPGFTVAVFSEADVPAGSSVYAEPVPAAPRKYHEFASVLLDAQPFITAETYGGRYIVAMRFERLGKMQDCHAALLALLQSGGGK